MSESTHEGRSQGLAIKQITCYFDFISPYAYLAFEHLPQALEGISYAMTYKPVLFAGMLKHHGQLGPAEIAPKRDWTYRQVLWLAQRHGMELQLPRSHPFNPLGLLRLAVACDAQGLPNRYVVETIFRHVWCGGEAAADAERLTQLTEKLAPSRGPDSEAVKAQLKAHTEESIAKNVFGVPTFEVDGKLFWGFDALPMLRDYLLGHAWFAGKDWTHAASIAQGVRR